MKQVMVLGLRQIMRENISLSYLKATNLPVDCVFFRTNLGMAEFLFDVGIIFVQKDIFEQRRQGFEIGT